MNVVTMPNMPFGAFGVREDVAVERPDARRVVRSEEVRRHVHQHGEASPGAMESVSTVYGAGSG